jgi:DNA processing protein
MKVKHLTYNASVYPPLLQAIPSPPQQLFYIGAEPDAWLARPRVAIVGSRAVSVYGKTVTARFATELAERGVCIVSGLALGVDAIAHEAALNVGGMHLAVLPCGLDRVYPAAHRNLAERLLAAGGALISEYPAGTGGMKQDFIARNRIVSGLADVLLITEASEKSGTLHTARFALEQGKDIGVVPGNITSPTSVGTNNLIKTGAIPITCIDDILHILTPNQGQLMPLTRIHHGDNANEQRILDLLYQGMSNGHELLTSSSLSPDLFTQTLTMLELSGKIRPLGNNHWATS